MCVKFLFRIFCMPSANLEPAKNCKARDSAHIIHQTNMTTRWPIQMQTTTIKMRNMIQNVNVNDR